MAGPASAPASGPAVALASCPLCTSYDTLTDTQNGDLDPREQVAFLLVSSTMECTLALGVDGLRGQGTCAVDRVDVWDLCRLGGCVGGREDVFQWDYEQEERDGEVVVCLVRAGVMLPGERSDDSMERCTSGERLQLDEAYGHVLGD